MSRVIVLGGAGQVGSVAVEALVASGEFSEVAVADYAIEKAREFISLVGSDKLSAHFCDARDPQSIKDVVKGYDIVLNCVGPFYKTQTTVVKAIIEAGKNYVDIADDVGAYVDTLKLDDAAKRAGILAVIGMGASPGVTNLIAKLFSDLLDETDSIDIFHTHGGEPIEGEGVIAHRFYCMSIDIPMFLDGELKYFKYFGKDGIALREEVYFPELGRSVLLYPYPHPEQVTLPKYIKGVKRVTNKGSVLPDEYYQLIRDMVKLGLTSTEPLDVKGQKVVPYDFAVAYIIRERDRILRETNFGPQRGGFAEVVKGKKNGRPHEYAVRGTPGEKRPKKKPKPSALEQRRSRLGIRTGIPAAVAVVLMSQGRVKGKGVLPPEACISPVDFFPLRERITERVTGEKPSKMRIESTDYAGNVTVLDIEDIIAKMGAI